MNRSLTTKWHLDSSVRRNDGVYNIEFNATGIVITHDENEVRWVQDHDTGDGWVGTSKFRNPLLKLMAGGKIFPPNQLLDCLTQLWEAWFNNDDEGDDDPVDDERVRKLLRELETWINTVTAAKPPDEFWRIVF